MKKMFTFGTVFRGGSIAQNSCVRRKKHNLFGILSIVFCLAIGSSAMANDASMTANVITDTMAMTSVNAAVLHSTNDKHTNIFGDVAEINSSNKSSSNLNSSNKSSSVRKQHK